jgi:tetratricopeptide (TPR) repeat protein/predicted Ser/Thr protein kinase
VSAIESLDEFSSDEGIAAPMRRLAEAEDDEAARMLERLSARLFDGEAPHEQVGRFELRERLGAGAMGVVYAAWDPQLDRRVAIKLLRATPGRASDPDSGRRLLREAKAMARLRHPNVIQVHEVGEHRGQIFVAMEIIEGLSLREWLARARPWQAIVEVFLAAGRGLAAAHRAGVIHRDFKPDNVLIEGERVFVGDFGLARGLELEARVEEGEGAPARPDVDTILTQTGASVGTPAYMAPEAFEGVAPDARADQYAFCVSLYEALHGQRPFAQQTLTSLVAAKRELSLAPDDPAVRVQIPRWLERIVRRGLDPRPDARFTSMDELLAALTSEGRRRRWLRSGAYSTLTVAAAALVGALAVSLRDGDARDASPPCVGAKTRVLEVWDAPRRARIEAAFAAAELPYADVLSERVSTRVDDYTQTWVEGHRDACEATVVRNEQSEHALDLRMRCLDRRLTELDALLDRLEQPTSRDVTHSVQALAKLTPVSSCEELERLESSTPSPEDPDIRAGVETAREELAQLEAAIWTGHYEDVEARAAALVERAEALDYRPLTAEATYLYGMILSRVGEPQAAETMLEQAIFAAQASGYDELAARAMVGAVYVVGSAMHEVDGGRRYVRQAQALIEHLGNPPRSITALAGNAGTVEFAAGNYAEAKAYFERAIELNIALDGEGNHRVAEARANLAAVERRLDNVDRALELYAMAKRDLERDLGPHHPSVLSLLNNMAAAYIHAGRHAEAEATLVEAIALAETIHPDGHPSVGHSLNNLGEVLLLQGRYAEARERYTAAIAIWDRTLGPDHPTLGYPLTGRGAVALELGDPQRAREDLERAYELRTHNEVPPTSLGETEFLLARALAELDVHAPEPRALASSALEHLDGADGDLVTNAEVVAWLGDLQ